MTSRHAATSMSIVEHIRAHLPESGPGLTAGGDELPDEQDWEGPVRFAAGAWDGIVTHNVGGGGDASELDRLLHAVRRAATGWRRARHYARLTAVAQDVSLVRVIDPLLERLRDGRIPPRRIYKLGLRLAAEGRQREPVKLGIALLGLFRAEPHRELLLTLGRHEEFTLYAAVALSNGQEDPVDDLWQLARNVTGWGRIHVVERLADTTRADILDWLVRDGFRNSVMDEYLAYLAASRGQLAERLRGEVDDQLLHAAGDILTALFNGGPAQDITHYADGAAVTELLIGHLRHRASDLRHLLAVHAVREYVSRDDPDGGWPDGWTADLRQRLRDQCAEIISRPQWEQLTLAALESDDPQTFHRADAVATRVLGMSTLSTHLRLLREGSPLGNWHAAMSQVDESTIDEIVDLAVELLPLSRIATGPAGELGLGPSYAPHSALQFVLQGLVDWPGRGWALVKAGLSSLVIPNRNAAGRVLCRWPRDSWPAEAEASLRAAIDVEPDPRCKQWLTEVLQGVATDA